MKICPVGDQLFQGTDWQVGRLADTTKLIAAFRSFTNAPKKKCMK